MTKEQYDNYDKAMDFVNRLNNLMTDDMRVIEKEMHIKCKRNLKLSIQHGCKMWVVTEPVYGYKLWIYPYACTGHLGTEI